MATVTLVYPNDQILANVRAQLQAMGGLDLFTVRVTTNALQVNGSSPERVLEILDLLKIRGLILG